MTKTDMEYNGRLFKDFQTQTIIGVLEKMREELGDELNIQLKVQEKAKQIVVFGRAKVAGMVADKYTRIGKIELLKNQISYIDEQLKELKK